MRSLFILALCLFDVSAKTVVWVSNNSPYRVTATWDPNLISDSRLTSLLQAFFYAYPKMVSKYNTKAPQSITWNFDPNYNGVASTSAGVTKFSTKYFGPKSDAGAAVHESMHIVQAYRKFFGVLGKLIMVLNTGKY
jgi:hypothetical protein